MTTLGEAGLTCWKWCASSSRIIAKPFAGEGSHLKARVDPPRSFEADEDEVVKVMPNVPSPSVSFSYGVEESGQCKKLRAPFNLWAIKQATGLMFGSSRPSPVNSHGPPSASMTVQDVAATMAVSGHHLHLVRQFPLFFPPCLLRWSLSCSCYYSSFFYYRATT